MYKVFLVDLVYVGLAHARPNKKGCNTYEPACIHTHNIMRVHAQFIYRIDLKERPPKLHWSRGEWAHLWGPSIVHPRAVFKSQLTPQSSLRHQIPVPQPITMLATGYRWARKIIIQFTHTHIQNNETAAMETSLRTCLQKIIEYLRQTLVSNAI